MSTIPAFNALGQPVSRHYASQPAIVCRLIAAGEKGDIDTIEALRDQLAELGLARPRTASGKFQPRGAARQTAAASPAAATAAPETAGSV